MQATKQRGRPKRVTTEQVHAPEFGLKLTIYRDVYSATAPTVFEALEKLPAPPKIFLKGALEVSYGAKTRVLPLNIPQIKRLYNPKTRVYLDKQLSFGMV